MKSKGLGPSMVTVSTINSSKYSSEKDALRTRDELQTLITLYIPLISRS